MALPVIVEAVENEDFQDTLKIHRLYFDCFFTHLRCCDIVSLVLYVFYRKILHGYIFVEKR